MVIARDLSETVTVADLPGVNVSIVFDTETGLAIGFGLRATRSEACGNAIETALTQPTEGAPFEPGPPAHVVCRADDVADVGAQLTAHLGSGAPSPEAVVPSDETEDMIDSLVSHLIGRAQPDDPPTPVVWNSLYAATHTYAGAEPWTTPRDDDDLGIVVTVDGDERQYVAVVMGYEGIQRGLALYPGTELPEEFLNWDPEQGGDDPPVPKGTVLLHLLTRDEVPADLDNKATRYGWPAGSELVPVFIAFGGEGVTDIGRRDADMLTTAMSAIVDFDRRTSLVAGTRGAVELADDQRADYVLRSRAGMAAVLGGEREQA